MCIYQFYIDHGMSVECLYELVDRRRWVQRFEEAPDRFPVLVRSAHPAATGVPHSYAFAFNLVNIGTYL
jgi:hypothetical protein